MRRIHCCEFKQSAPRINGKREETRYLNEIQKRTMNLKQKERRGRSKNEVLKLTLRSKCS